MAIGVLLSTVSFAAWASDPVVGEYRSTDAPDTASRLELTADGHFRYMLSEGALDEGAEGRWRRDGDVIRLFTQPRPVPPRFVMESMTREGEGGLSVSVKGQDGHGLPGIDFRITFDKAEAIEAYTQSYGWRSDLPGGSAPQTIQFHEPIFGILSEVLPIPPETHSINMVLEANDAGVADFQGTELITAGSGLTLRHRLGDRHYERVE